MKTLSGLLVVAFAAMNQSIASEPQTIRLVCMYTSTIDQDGRQESLSGEELVTINYNNDGRAKVSIKNNFGGGWGLNGIVTQEEIRADGDYGVVGTPVSQRLYINRFTGAFTLSVKWSDKTSHINYGKCQTVTRPLF